MRPNNAHPLKLESLECRTNPSYVTFDPGTNTVIITGWPMEANSFSVSGNGSGVVIADSGAAITVDPAYTTQFASIGGGAYAFAGTVARVHVAGDDMADTINGTGLSIPLTANGGGGNDTITGGTADDELFGGAGNDIVMGEDGSDELYGDAGNDLLYGQDINSGESDGNDTDFMLGGDDDDALYGNGGDDQLSGQDGNDALFGGHGVDFILGGIGNDVIGCGDGADFAWGEEGNDTISGGAGAGPAHQNFAFASTVSR